MSEDAELRRSLHEFGVDVGPLDTTTRPLYQRMLRKRINKQRASVVGSASKRPRLEPLPRASIPPLPLSSRKLRQDPMPSAPARNPSVRRGHVHLVQKQRKREVLALRGGRSSVGGASFGRPRPTPPNRARRNSDVIAPPAPFPPAQHNITHIPPLPPSPSSTPSLSSSSPRPIKPVLRTPPRPSLPPSPRTLSPLPATPGSGVVATITNWIGDHVKKIMDQLQEAASPRQPPNSRPQQQQVKGGVSPHSPRAPLQQHSHNSVAIDEVDFCEEGVSSGSSGVYLLGPPKEAGRMPASSPSSSSPPSSKPIERYDWELLPSDVEICKKSDKQLWILGRGGCGEVYRGLKDRVDDVAVKVIRLQVSVGDSGAAVAQFKKEIDIISKLRHRHILQFYGACIQPSCLFMVTELMDTDLFSALQQCTQYTWDGVYGKDVLAGVAAGLHHLHSRRPPIVHRDIKSPNILVMKGLVKIADVGIAHTMCTSDMTAQRGYTVAWAAPEVILRQRATEKIDIWSFGVILWEVVTGRVPHPGQLGFPTCAPAHLPILYRRCTSNTPTNRPSAAELTRTFKLS